MTTLLERFIPEARDYLESAAQGLLKLERTPSAEGLVNEVFRAVHTLKGTSGLFDLPGLTRVVHAGEDLLGAVRSNQRALDSDMVDALLDGLDKVSAWVDELERHGCLPDDAESVSVELSRRLRSLLPDRVDAGGAASATVVAQVDWLGELAEADRLAAFAETVAGGAPLLAIAYLPDDQCFYRGEDPFNLFPLLAGLKALRVYFREPPSPLSETDPFHCALAFRALTGQPRSEVEHLFRYVIEQVAITPVAPEALILPCSDADGGPGDAAFAEEARSRLAARDFAGLRAGVAECLRAASGSAQVMSALRWLDAVLAAPLPNIAWANALLASIADGRPHPIGAAAAENAAPPAAASVPQPPVAVAAADRPMAARILDEQMRIIGMPGDAETLQRRMAAVETTLTHLLNSLGWSTRDMELPAALAAAADGSPGRLESLIAGLQERVEHAVAGPAPPETATALLATGREPKAPGEAAQLAHVLKVDSAKVDALMNLIAELVVSKNSLPFLAKRAEDVYGSRDMGREIKDQYGIIDRLAQGMQRAIMDVRMLPVSEVFERFPRLVRDLSRKLNKHIDLRIVGEDTAADKTIIESLGDPLIHLVRNAVDHGVETPAEREAAGKPAAATIELKAFQEGDRVIIEVSDDGRGIDPAAIRLKAFEKGLITEDKVDTLSDQAAIDLIFLPGFSTVEQVSDLSGRGVGMDVVRTAVERIHGQVMLASRKGDGTMVRLSLPLSMAVARVLMVEVGSSLFGVPMDGVAETVRVPKNGIRRIKRSEAFVLRDAIVPLVHMHTLLDVPHVAADVDEMAVLVARVGGASMGLVVDRLREGIDVILKPLDGVLAGMRGYSGTALLGDGRVLLVLNLKELL